jgi:cytochrome c oxidase assembly protein subunit 11
MSYRGNHSSGKQATTVLVIALLVFMIGLSFASVPLYRIFCQKTGYGGAPQIAPEECRQVITSRTIRVRFNADVHRDLPWLFKPLQIELEVHPGQTGLAFYEVHNQSSNSVVGIATYNVTPEKAGIYFNKIDCFCFEEQTVKAGATIDMPVQFFISPEIVDDPNMSDIKVITLSYTFFSAKDPNIPKILGLPSAQRKDRRH